MNDRRDFLKKLGTGAGLLAVPGVFAQREATGSLTASRPNNPAVKSATTPVPVETPDVKDLPWRVVNGVKEFHLVAEPVKRELIPGKVIDVWGFNGSVPGPTIQVTQGDAVRIIVDNHLPEPTSIHWHGFEIPNNMDGVPGVSQKPIPPGGRFVYEFTLHQAGTFFYHSHMAMQEMMGMIGAFIMHPKKAYQPVVDRDFAIVLQEFAVLPNNPIPNSMNMEFNWLTMNGKSGPAATPLITRLGQRVRIRLINLGMDHHPIHLHGMTFIVTGTEGGRQPRTTWGPKNTVLVGVAEAYDVEFEANNPGDWMLHCHLPHHMMNQMSSVVGPMTRKPRMPAGIGMEQGMGIPQQGSALSDEYGPSLGRGMGVGSTNDTRMSNGPLAGEAMQHTMPGMEHQMPGMQHETHEGMQMGAEVSPDANKVPGFPQDAFMEGPTMAMDKMVAKPETYGLPSGWSGFVQGMMTLVRVLPPDLYDKIMSMREQQQKQPAMPGMEHQHPRGGQ